MLHLNGLHYSAGPFSLAADFHIAEGGLVAVIGPSGAGKSTLLDLIAGFRAPQTGQVLINGQDVTQLRPGARPVATLFQDNNLFPHLTVVDNLILAINPKTGRASAADHERIHQALDQVGLAQMSGRKPGTLSGGQQSRAALARVLLQDRPVVLLDEPFAALGPALKADMLGLVVRLTKQLGALTLLVTHDPQDALRHADRTVLVAEGAALTPQPTQALFANPPPALAGYLGDSR